MKIALVGTAPSSMRLAPFGDPSYLIWGCSPGLYPYAPRVDAWFELHRYEPPVIGKPDQQVQWFSPEYCAWMAKLPCTVWMREAVPAIPRSETLPHQDLVKKYGHFFFTSSLAWMAAMAIEAILLNRELLKAGVPEAKPIGPEGEMIGFWGVDMAATEEYGYQRAGCQFFATLAASMGIKVHVPPESDLMTPAPLYGIFEGDHRAIKYLARHRELSGRRDALAAQVASLSNSLHFVNGAIDDMNYHMQMWQHEGQVLGTRFEDIFAPKEAPQVSYLSEMTRIPPIGSVTPSET